LPPPTIPTLDDVRDLLVGSREKATSSREEIRRTMSARKLERIRARIGALRKVEKRAVVLLRRVDYSKPIVPTLVLAAEKDRDLWTYLRNVLHSAPWNGRTGRLNRFFSVDPASKGILGIVDVGSDVYALGLRDTHIGWDRDTRFHSGRLQAIGNIGTCVCSAPFGLLCGSKFQVVATLSTFLLELWAKRYGQPLAAVSTTSLYGKSSAYNRVREFAYLGTTTGGGHFHFSDQDFRLLRRWIAAEGVTLPRKGGAYTPRSKFEILVAACKRAGIPHESIRSNQPRGVYFAETSENSLAWLRGDEPDLRPIDRQLDQVGEWWWDRWGSMRQPKKIDEIRDFDFDRYRLVRQIAELEKETK
jgi:hypothetical protein